MNREKITEILDGIDAAYAEEASAVLYGGKRRTKMPGPGKPWRRAIAAAAVLLILIGAGAGFAAEASEYRKAAEFFESNGLTTEGLSRTEVKAVYKDIITRKFTYGKTAEVISRLIPGMEIITEDMSPAELEQIWQSADSSNANTARASSIRCEINIIEKEDEYNYIHFDKSVIDCYRILESGAKEKLWSCDIHSFCVTDCMQVSDGFAVWGRDYEFPGEIRSFVAFIDSSGKLRWENAVEEADQVRSVVERPDGTIAAMGNGKNRELFLKLYDKDGKLQAFRTSKAGGGSYIRDAVSFGDGYLLRLINTASGDTAHIVRMSADWEPLSDLTYEEEGSDYYITDMVGYGDRVYLSAYAVPEQKDPGGRHEIADILSEIFQRIMGEKEFDIPSEDLTPMLKANYTAVLLLCDPNSVEPETFFTVKGCLGGKLTAGEDGLQWDVYSFRSSFFSPATSAFSICAECGIFRYTFNGDGRLNGMKDTGETYMYYR